MAEASMVAMAEEFESDRLILADIDSTATAAAPPVAVASAATAGSKPGDGSSRCGCFGGNRKSTKVSAAAAEAAAVAAAANTLAAALAATRHRPASLTELCNRTRFSREELRRLYRGFKTDCPSGVVRRDALRDIFSQIFPLGDATAFADLVFDSLVPSGVGSGVTFDAAVIALSAMSRGDPQERLAWAFRLYDSDHDGRVTRSEVTRLVIAVYDLLGPSVRPRVAPGDAERHAERAFRRLRGAAAGDSPEAGGVTFAEFAKACGQGRDLEKDFACLETYI